MAGSEIRTAPSLTGLLNGLLVLTMVPAMPAQSQGPPLQFNPPKSYYLALGDSLAYGFQSFKFAEGLPPSAAIRKVHGNHQPFVPPLRVDEGCANFGVTRRSVADLTNR